MKIIHVATADDPFGCPWPPSSTDNWHAVRHNNGFTVWRAIGAEQFDEPLSAVQPSADSGMQLRGTLKMATKEERFPKRFLSAPDLKGNSVKLEIRREYM